MKYLVQKGNGVVIIRTPGSKVVAQILPVTDVEITYAGATIPGLTPIGQTEIEFEFALKPRGVSAARSRVKKKARKKIGVRLPDGEPR